ncbi:MAG TPA: hypothetical protein PLN26_03340 [Acidobacteriota bacterium]|nr:hypothetical protein [Acidobacteriota bacterium]
MDVPPVNVMRGAGERSPAQSFRSVDRRGTRRVEHLATTSIMSLLANRPEKGFPAEQRKTCSGYPVHVFLNGDIQV